MKVAIVLDYWKLPIFEHRLSQAGYIYEKGPGITKDTIILKVETEDVDALSIVIHEANCEAAKEVDTAKASTLH